MPATSQKQQMMMAIAKHEPGKLFARNRGVLKMGKGKLGEFASTPRKGLPKKAKRRKKAHWSDKIK